MSQKIGVTLSDEAFADLMTAYQEYLRECDVPDKRIIPLSITGYAAVMLNFGVQIKLKGTDL